MALNLQVVRSFPYPSDSKESHRFLEMGAGFYKKSIPKFSKIVLPLFERMRLSPKGSFILNESERHAFNSVIKELNDASALANLQSNCTNYQLVTDSKKLWCCITTN